MEKPAETQHPIHDLLRRRWSPRAFSDRPLEPAVLCSLLEAVRWAPSSYNEQPWSFIIATRQQPADYQRLLDYLVEGNRLWAAGAPVLMLSVAKLAFARNAKPNRHAFHDVGLAVMSLVVQATALGLFVHQMAGFDVEKARAVFAIPAGHEPVAALALGYPGSPDSLPERLREREQAPRTRKRLAEFVFGARWGEAAPLLDDCT